MQGVDCFDIIVAVDDKWGIGKNNDMAWRIREDFRHFVKTTTTTIDKNLKNCVIMGSNTWKSLPTNSKPLKNRINIIVSRNKDLRSQENISDDVYIVDSLLKALDVAKKSNFSQFIENTFIIGGAQIYKEALNLKQLENNNYQCKKIIVTHISGDYDCDTFFPDLTTSAYCDDYKPFTTTKSEMQKENNFEFYFVEYRPSLLCLFNKSF